MKLHLQVALVALVVMRAGSAAAETASGNGTWITPSAPQIREILIDRIDQQQQGVGIVVGVIDAKGRRVIAYGHSKPNDNVQLNGKTLFEIGSMTKVFTALLLADMAERHEVALSDPVSKYLPGSVHIPARGDTKITLLDLATHTSGLPRMATNMTSKDPANPYADYTEGQLYDFLNNYSLSRDIGTTYVYSNLGGALLGHALTRKAGANYEDLFRARIGEPLGMVDTWVTLPPQAKRRLAQGHTAALEPTTNRQWQVLVGAGGLKSTADDLLRLLAAELGYSKSSLAPALKAQLSVRRPTDKPDRKVALGWHINASPVGDIVWHNGGTGGYRSFVGFAPTTGVGIVVLANAATANGADDIGFHLLSGKPLNEPIKARTSIPVDPEILEQYVGEYKIGRQRLKIARRGARLFSQLDGQGEIEIYPETTVAFFMKAMDFQIIFQGPPQGKATGVEIRQNERAAGTGVRLADEAGPN